jgi:hypothetical protein
MASLTQTIVPALGEPSTPSFDRAREGVQYTEGGVWCYRLSLLFLTLYFIRPQDLIPGLAGFSIIRPVMMLWFLALLGERSRSPLPGWLRTPTDWAILFLYAFIAWNAPSEAGAKMGMFSLVVFYYLTTQALSSWERVLGYLRLWNKLLLILASLGALQVLGIDLTHGKELTDFFLGRLALGTWITDNPNALGHTVVVAIPLSYLLFFWRGSTLSRFILFPLCVTLAGWCVYQTGSKGAFIVGGILTVLLFVVGRPRWMQILVVAAALTIGVGALSFLPRMEKMGNLRADDGVQGRLLAWEKAEMALRQNPTGVGWKQFIALVDWKEGNYWHYADPKSTHSSYVQIGADLGQYGLFVWLLVLWTALRSVIFFKSQTDEEERCRRAILLMVIAYMASGWMINREYHTEYYLLVALAAALHRLNVSQSTQPILKPDTAPKEQEPSATISRPAIAGLQWAPQTDDTGLWLESVPEALTAKGSPTRPVWNRINWLDISVAIAMTWGVIEIWNYVLINL